VRVTTAFNKLLRLPGASVVGVTFGAEGVVVAVRLRRRRSRCSGCGRKAPIHDRSTRRWRHLDLGAQRCYLEAEIRRVRCPECGVKVEEVPFARPGARHTRDFEDLTAFLAQQANKTVIAKLLRIDWSTVGRIVERVVDEHLDETRLAGLAMVGVDEVSWRKRHRYLTCVADHIGGGVVWVAEGRSAATLQGFFEELGGDAATIQAVSIDMSAGYEKAVREAIPHAQIAFDPFPCRKGAPRGATGSREVRDLAAGLSRQPGEAEGSLTPELRGKAASSPNNDAAREHCRMARARQARPKGVTEVNQCQNPLERGPRLKPDGYGPGQAVRGNPYVLGDRLDQRIDALGRDRKACPREHCGRPAGEELDADPVKRTVVNVGTVPASPTRPSGRRLGAASADGAGMGRSSRSSRRGDDRPRRAGKPSTGRRGAAGLQRPSVMRGGRR